MVENAQYILIVNLLSPYHKILATARSDILNILKIQLYICTIFKQKTDYYVVFYGSVLFMVQTVNQTGYRMWHKLFTLSMVGFISGTQLYSCTAQVFLIRTCVRHVNFNGITNIQLLIHAYRFQHCIKVDCFTVVSNVIWKKRHSGVLKVHGTLIKWMTF